MSRIGKQPISIPQGVSIKIQNGNVIEVNGPLGELTQKVDADIVVKVENEEIKLERPTNQPRHRAMHGLYRALIQNMVTGVSKGYEIKQELVGVGYKAEVKGQIIDFSLGYSHDIQFELPAEIKAAVVSEKKRNPVLTLTGIDKQLLGQVAAKIRSFRERKSVV